MAETWGKRQDGMIVSCLREEELTRRDIHEAVMPRGRYCCGSVEESEDKNANMGSKSWQKLGMTLTVKSFAQKW